MIVSNNVSPLWQAVPGDIIKQTEQAIDKGLEKAPGGAAEVFFRADDVAVPGNAYTAMCLAFQAGRAPLCLAVVPAWLTQSRWATLRRDAAPGELFSFSQHGWRHMNFEPQGVKKREFGQARPARDKRMDLSKGFRRMGEIMGADFTPVFTPPWNRCDGESLEAMPGIGIKAVSRTVGAGPDTPAGLPDFPIRVDLHTRKEADPQASLAAMLAELTEGLASGRCGVMLHHQRMNQAGLEYLKDMLAVLKTRPGIRMVHFGHLLGE